MKNKPVAWGMTWKDGEIYDVISPAQHAKEEGDYTVPLYTHPVKELKPKIRRACKKCIEQQAEIDFLKKEILAKHEDWKHEGQQASNARAEIEMLKAKLNADKFCDANCVWTDHHPDCQIGKAQEMKALDPLELAVLIEKNIITEHGLSEVVLCLRQQQAELEHMDMANRVLEAEIEALKESKKEDVAEIYKQQAEIEVNKYGYELDLNIKIEELKEKDVCLKLLMDKICQQQAEIESLRKSKTITTDALEGIAYRHCGDTHSLDEVGFAKELGFEVLKEKLDEAEQRYWNNK